MEFADIFQIMVNTILGKLMATWKICSNCINDENDIFKVCVNENNIDIIVLMRINLNTTFKKQCYKTAANVYIS